MLLPAEGVLRREGILTVVEPPVVKPLPLAECTRRLPASEAWRGRGGQMGRGQRLRNGGPWWHGALFSSHGLVVESRSSIR